MSARADSEAAQVQANSGVTPDHLRSTLTTALDATHVEIRDMSGMLLPVFATHARLKAFMIDVLYEPHLWWSQEHQRQAARADIHHLILPGGCGQMFEAVIVSSKFVGKNRLARTRLVNGTLKAEIAAIHAWTPKCLTPEEWEKAKAAQN